VTEKKARRIDDADRLRKDLKFFAGLWTIETIKRRLDF
jgi:hypothetical protein